MSELSQLIEENGAELSILIDDFHNINKDNPWPYERIFNIATSPKPVLVGGTTGTASYDRVEQVQDGNIAQLDPELRTITWNERPFGGTIRLPRSILRDRMQTMQHLSDELNAHKAAINRAACRLLDNAFSSAPEHAGWDGKPLCATDHVLISGHTQSNKGTDAFTADELETQVNSLLDLKNQSGVELNAWGDTVIVPSGALTKAARKASGSPLEPGSSDNAINVAYGINVIPVPTLKDKNNWFVAESMGMKANMRFHYQEPIQISLDMATADTLHYYIPTRVVCAWTFINHNFIKGFEVA